MAVRKKGIYSVATVTNIRIARNGWKVNVAYPYNNCVNYGEGLNDIADFNRNDIGNRYFIKFQKKDPDGNHILIPTIKVPDSVQLVPSEGWSEEWMLEYFPKVVEYVHDTK